MELIRIKKARGGKVRAQLIGGNGEILLTSEPLSGIQQAVTNLASARYALCDLQHFVKMPDGSVTQLGVLLEKKEEQDHNRTA
jgi:uncharacterized protein YegP (UPF0339 family)